MSFHHTQVAPAGWGRRTVRATGCAAALLLAQPMVYLAFGAAFGLSVFGGILSILSDGGASMRNLLLLVVHFLLAALSLSYVFGLV